MNRRSFFGAVAAAPIVLPGLVAKAATPTGTTIGALKVQIDTSSLRAEADSIFARMRPYWLTANHVRQLEDALSVEAQMNEHDLFEPGCLFKTGVGQ